jgi:hypothetical protein
LVFCVLLVQVTRRSLIEGLAFAMILCLAELQCGCARTSNPTSRAGTPVGTYINITVTATGGSQQASATLSLTVN